MSGEKVAKNTVVTFTYVIQDAQGEFLEQSDIPLSYLHDQDDRMFPKIIAAMEGAGVGDMIVVTLSPEEGFGARNPELSYSDRIENVPPEYQHIGAEAMFQNDAGESITMRVVSLQDGMISLDGNHPFAGKEVVFRIKVTGIRAATEQEIGAGQPAENMSMPALH